MNQQRQVVEEVLDYGREFGFDSRRGRSRSCWRWRRRRCNDTPIICNGFKDAEFIEMAMLAQKIGRTVIPVVEKHTELGLILKYAECGKRAAADRDAKPGARGGGRWQGSAATARSSVSPWQRCCEVSRNCARAAWKTWLRAAALPSWQPDPQHPHRRWRSPEAACLHRVEKGRRWPRVSRCRRGLGIDYDGRRPTSNPASTTLEEYANDVVYHIQSVRRRRREDPIIVSESGRAIARYHSVLIFNVLGVSAFGEEKIPESIKDDEAEQPVIDLLETYQNLSPRNALESYHDAQQALDMALGSIQRRLPAARAALPGREPLLGHPGEVEKDRGRHGGSARRPPGSRRCDGGYVFL